MDVSDSLQHGRLTRRDVRTLLLAALGGTLEFYDFIVFNFLTAEIGALFFPKSAPGAARLATLGIFVAGYFARPLGGIAMAHLGDRTGRKRMFMLSVLLMAAPTLAIGLLPTFAQIGFAAPLLLLAMRLLQGAAIGGEAPGAWVFVAEHMPPGRVGLACGLLTGGLTGGILLGSLVATWLHAAFTQEVILDWAWRIPFLIGGVLGVVAMQLRRWLNETPVFAAMQARRTFAELPLRTVLAERRGAVAASMLVSWMLTAVIVTFILRTPEIMKGLHPVNAAVEAQSTTDTAGINTERALQGSVAATLFLSLATAGVGWLLDRFGAALVGVTVGAALIASGYALYRYADAGTLVPLHALVGAGAGLVTIVPFTMVRIFPANVRITGVSFCYNMVYAISSGVTLYLLEWGVARDPLFPAHYVAIAVVVGIAAALYGETLARRAATDGTGLAAPLEIR
nr:proline/betaine transporter [uncultured bacterium]